MDVLLGSAVMVNVLLPLPLDMLPLAQDTSEEMVHEVLLVIAIEREVPPKAGGR